MGKLTIEEFPGTIIDALGCTEYEYDTILNTVLRPYVKEDVNSFEYLYLTDLRKLSEIPWLIGISERTASAWAADLIGTASQELKKMRDVIGFQEKPSVKASNGFDIYEYAKTTNADYMDMKTGYIYLVQNYNRAKRLGLPTAGIAVFDPMESKTIGYAMPAGV